MKLGHYKTRRIQIHSSARHTLYDRTRNQEELNTQTILGKINKCKYKWLLLYYSAAHHRILYCTINRCNKTKKYLLMGSTPTIYFLHVLVDLLVLLENGFNKGRNMWEAEFSSTPQWRECFDLTNIKYTYIYIWYFHRMDKYIRPDANMIYQWAVIRKPECPLKRFPNCYIETGMNHEA